MPGEKKPAAKRPIETYEHKGKQRANNPPVGLVTPGTDADTDDDGCSLYPRQVFFPIAGPSQGWRQAKNLRAEIEEEIIDAYRRTVSLPFEPGAHQRIAVKIVDDRGIESLKVIEADP